MLIQRDVKRTPAGSFLALLNRIDDLTSTSHSDTNTTVTVANNDNRVEAEATTAANHLRHPFDPHDAVVEPLSVTIALKAVRPPAVPTVHLHH